LLQRANTILFFTPQGRFADVREVEPKFESGLSHLAAKGTNAVFIPMALEFTYWEEKRPEILIRFGEPLQPTSVQTPKELNYILEARLMQATQRLADASIARETDAFQNLLTGTVGTNIIYDMWHRIKSVFTRQKFTPAHGTK
jgi:hypothetical protein